MTSYLWRDRKQGREAEEVMDHDGLHNKSRGDRSATRTPLSTQTVQNAKESQRLYLDNLKLWDCLALVRSDVSLSCQSAINLIFSLSNNDYLRAFPDALQFIHSHFSDGAVRYSTAEEAEVENMRLRQENIRLHAAVWVLRDNPGLQPDSALAAIFRLDDEKFKSKFPFVYESGDLGSLRSYSATGDVSENRRKSKKVRASSSPGQVSCARRCRSTSANRQHNNNGNRCQEHSVVSSSSRRSNSQWRHKDFTSNRIPTVSSWDQPPSPDPPMTITHGVRSRCQRSTNVHRIRLNRDPPSLSDNQTANSTRRSPSAMGRIEGQNGKLSDSDGGPALLRFDTKVRDDLQHCSDKLGLEVMTSAPRDRRSSLRNKVTFAEPLFNKENSRSSRKVKQKDTKSDYYFCPIQKREFSVQDQRNYLSLPEVSSHYALQDEIEEPEILESPVRRFSLKIPIIENNHISCLNKSANCNCDISQNSDIFAEEEDQFLNEDSAHTGDPESQNQSQCSGIEDMPIPSASVGKTDNRNSNKTNLENCNPNITSGKNCNMNRRRAYNVDQHDNVLHAEDTFASFNDLLPSRAERRRSINTRGSSFKAGKVTKKTVTLSEKDAENKHKVELRDSSKKTQFQAAAVSLSDFPAQSIHVIGRPFPVASCPTASLLVNRLNALQQKTEDRTCQYPFRKFETMSDKLGPPVFTDVNQLGGSGDRMAKTESKQGARLQTEITLKNASYPTSKSSVKKNTLQNNMEKKGFQKRSSVDQRSRSTSFANFKIDSIKEWESNSYDNSSKEDFETTGESGDEFRPKIGGDSSGGRAALRGCDDCSNTLLKLCHRELQKKPKTQLTAKLDVMVKRNIKRDAWKPESRYANSLICPNGAQVYEPLEVDRSEMTLGASMKTMREKDKVHVQGEKLNGVFDEFVDKSQPPDWRSYNPGKMFHKRQ